MNSAPKPRPMMATLTFLSAAFAIRDRDSPDEDSKMNRQRSWPELPERAIYLLRSPPVACNLPITYAICLDVSFFWPISYDDGCSARRDIAFSRLREERRMWTVVGKSAQTCDGVSRRTMLQV